MTIVTPDHLTAIISRVSAAKGLCVPCVGVTFVILLLICAVTAIIWEHTTDQRYGVGSENGGKGIHTTNLALGNQLTNSPWLMLWTMKRSYSVGIVIGGCGLLKETLTDLLLAIGVSNVAL